jgi:hypothetical protein
MKSPDSVVFCFENMTQTMRVKLGTPPRFELTGFWSKSLGTVYLPVHIQALDREP